MFVGGGVVHPRYGLDDAAAPVPNPCCKPTEFLLNAHNGIFVVSVSEKRNGANPAPTVYK